MFITGPRDSGYCRSNPCYPQKLRTELITYASRLHGLGFALVQYEPNSITPQIVQCGSRTLSDCETRYSTVELDLLGVVFGLKKCRFYLKGMPHFTVVTDHKPLVGLFKKHLHDIANDHILRLRDKVISYNFEVKWLKGKLNEQRCLTPLPSFNRAELFQVLIYL